MKPVIQVIIIREWRFSYCYVPGNGKVRGFVEWLVGPIAIRFRFVPLGYWVPKVINAR